MREETQAWLEQAKDDYKYAEANLKIGVFYVCSFLAQQAAEKALKALYIETKRIVPAKTHNLIKLGKELKTPSYILEGLREINPVFVTTRYPDAANGRPTEMFNKKIAQNYLEIAKDVLQWVETQIN